MEQESHCHRYEQGFLPPAIIGKCEVETADESSGDDSWNTGETVAQGEWHDGYPALSLMPFSPFCNAREERANGPTSPTGVERRRP